MVARASSTFLGAPITFSGYGYGTIITNQYAPVGILFSSSDPSGPRIVNDLASQTPPVLAGGSGYVGNIRGSFVWPGSAVTAAVDSFSVVVGHIGLPGSTVVEAYGASGELLGSIPITQTGFVTVTSNFVGTTDFVVRIVTPDPAGWAIDDLRMGPEYLSPTPRDWSQSLGGSNPGQTPRNCNSGDPVSCSTGNMWETETDVAVPGRGPGLLASRTYNSLVAGVTDTLTYDAAHQLTKVTNGAVTTNYTYNAVGERTASTSSSIVGSRTAYQYDQGGRLTRFSGPPVQTMTDILGAPLPVNLNYTYDGFGLLGSLGWNLGEGSMPLLTADWLLGTYFITGPGGMVVEQLVLGDVPLYLHSDQLGSTRVVTDDQARPVIAFKYDSYGKTTATPIRRITGFDVSAITPIQFAGAWTDLKSGLIYLRNRWYDPVSANFLTRDPIEFTTGQPYSYANDDPTTYTDPTGQCPVCVLLLGGALFGALDIGAQAADHVAHGCSPFEQMNWGEVAGAAVQGALWVLPGASAGFAAKSESWLGGRLAMRNEAGAVRLPGGGPLSPNQMNRAILRGGAPKGLARVDRGKIPGEQTHIHFDDGSALNMDGTWKHGGTSLTNAQAEWLEANGWVVPR